MSSNSNIDTIGGGVIDFIKENGIYVYPITLIESIYNLNGTKLETILENKSNTNHNHDTVYAAKSHTHNYAGSSSAGGVANSANKLATARTITIGNKGKTFDGSADLSWSLSEIGAAASSHTHSYLSLSGGTMNGGINFPQGSGLLQNQNSTSNWTQLLFWKSEGETSTGYTAGIGRHNTGGDGNGAITIIPYRSSTQPWDGTTGLYVSKNQLKLDGKIVLTESNYSIYTAAKSHTHNYAGSSSAGGVANSAAKLSTARTITIGNKGKTFDGSANVSWTLAEIGAAESSHSHSYLSLRGGTLRGTLTLEGATTSGGSTSYKYTTIDAAASKITCTSVNAKTYYKNGTVMSSLSLTSTSPSSEDEDTLWAY